MEEDIRITLEHLQSILDMSDEDMGGCVVGEELKRAVQLLEERLQAAEDSPEGRAI